MGTVISLNEMNVDWEVLARAVERTGEPLWLELEGTVQGVLLPTVDAQRLMGSYTQACHSAAASSVFDQKCSTE